MDGIVDEVAGEAVDCELRAIATHSGSLPLVALDRVEAIGEGVGGLLGAA